MGEREPAKRLNRKAVSTVAGRAGGPAPSSGEASAGRGGGGAKGPGHLWCVRSINRERVFREKLGGQAEAVGLPRPKDSRLDRPGSSPAKAACKAARQPSRFSIRMFEPSQPRSSLVSVKNVTKSLSATSSGQPLSLASSTSDRNRTGMRHAIRADQCWTRLTMSGADDRPQEDPLAGPNPFLGRFDKVPAEAPSRGHYSDPQPRVGPLWENGLV